MMHSVKYQYSNSTKDLNSFVKHLTVEEINNLTVQEEIDYRDNVGRYCLAKIIAKKTLSRELRLHYIGWSAKWDEWVSFDDKNISRFAKARSISKKPGTKFLLRVGDKIDINCKVNNEIYGWKMGCVRTVDNDSGQIQVVFRANAPSDSKFIVTSNSNGDSLIWIQRWCHMDNPLEIDEFTAKSLYPDIEISRVQYQFKKINSKQFISMKYFNYVHFMKKLNSMYPCGEMLVYGYFRKQRLVYNKRQNVEISMVKVLPYVALKAITLFLGQCLLYVLSDIVYNVSLGQHKTLLINTHSFEMDGNTDINTEDYEIDTEINADKASEPSSPYTKRKLLMDSFSKIDLRVLRDWLIYCQPYIDNTVTYFKIANQKKLFGMNGTLWLYPILHYNSYIKQLVLTNNCLNDLCFKLLIKAISTNNHAPPISLLDISDNIQITDNGVESIFKVLLLTGITSNYDYRYLRELYMNNTCISDKSIVYFTEFVRKYTTHNIAMLSVLNNKYILENPSVTMHRHCSNTAHQLDGITILSNQQFRNE